MGKMLEMPECDEADMYPEFSCRHQARAMLPRPDVDSKHSTTSPALQTCQMSSDNKGAASRQPLPPEFGSSSRSEPPTLGPRHPAAEGRKAPPARRSQSKAIPRAPRSCRKECG